MDTHALYIPKAIRVVVVLYPNVSKQSGSRQLTNVVTTLAAPVVRMYKHHDDDICK